MISGSDHVLLSMLRNCVPHILILKKKKKKKEKDRWYFSVQISENVFTVARRPPEFWRATWFWLLVADLATEKFKIIFKMCVNFPMLATKTYAWGHQTKIIDSYNDSIVSSTFLCKVHRCYKTGW